MRIKKFQPKDRDEVLQIHNETYKHLRLEHFLWQPCQQIESLEKDSVKFVCKAEKVSGYGAVYQMERGNYKLNLIVAREIRRQKIGTRMLDKIENEIRKQGGKHLEARLIEGMDESLAFALARGFTEVH